VDLVVRPATGFDVPAISHLYLEVAEEVVRREPRLRHVPDQIDIERRYASRVNEADRAVLLGAFDGNVVAFVDAALIRHSDPSTFHAPGMDAYVEELIVTQAHRRQGVARTLMVEAEVWAREAGARVLTLDTHVANARGRALYDAIGYREVGVIYLKEL
jgi:ribosomal protein S18 acetylase RimI-like enzyme